MRIVVLGTGLLGSAVGDRARASGLEVVVLDRRAVDLELPVYDQLAARLRPGDVVVNAAAMTDVDACEGREPVAYRINAEAAGEVAVTVGRLGARLIHVSTDAVHDITNAYARSKAAGERLVRESAGPEATILRVSTTFGPGSGGSDFVGWVLRQSATGGRLRVATDMVSSPTYAPDAARALVAMATTGRRGTHQFVNHPGLSRYDFALLIRSVWQIEGPIVPISMEELRHVFRAPRPRSTAMENTLKDLVDPMPLRSCLEDYRDALRRAEAKGSG